MPKMWVFPGGRVDAADEAALAYVEGPVRDLPHPLGPATLVAGARETMEEAGIWLGEGDPGDLRAALAAGQAWSEALAARGLRLRVDGLWPWARWVTPVGEGRRFDTLFLLAAAPPAEGSADGLEVVAHGWFQPADVLAAGLAVMGLAPPTFWALSELAAAPSVSAALEQAAARNLEPVQPVRTMCDGELCFLLPGDDGHPEPSRAGLPSRLTLRDGAWVVTA
jgi:8-oxo-dGTP pyrophosphatase MutT (NUDIX family)